MKKLALLLSVAMILGVVALVAPTEVQAQETRPCCEGGFKPNKPCSNDNNCPGVCIGGGDAGKKCPPFDCGSACISGSSIGNDCTSDDNCNDACVGGSRDGEFCSGSVPCAGSCSPGGSECTNDGQCGGGTCVDIGTCTDLGVCGPPGVCDDGSCTALCLKPGGPKSPDEPASQWQQFQDFLAELEAEEEAQD